MLDLRLYRAGFAPVLAALIVLAFSLDGVPAPIEPGPVTLTFDQGRAAATARTIATRWPDRTPGSEDDLATADFVREQFAALESGTVTEQELEADDETLRNVSLILPGTTERTIVVTAARDSRAAPGAASSAAATGVLLELAQQLGVSDRNRTLVLASTDAGGAGAIGARELLAGLPDPDLVEAVVVVAQPGADEPRPPHLVTSSTDERSPPLELLRTAEAQLEDRAEVEPGLDGGLGQLARLALPGAAGEQAVLLGQGFDALAFSSAGEVPLGPGRDREADLDPAVVGRFGSAVLATIGALDALARAPDAGPDTYLRVAENIVPGWTLALLALTLLVPPAALALSALARARGDGAAATASGWALRWIWPPLGGLAALYVLALVGLIPRPATPFDPGRFELGPAEGLAMVVLITIVAAIWWIQGLRRVPAPTPRPTLAAACAAVGVAACLVAWLANPFLALLLVPLPHLIALYGRAAQTAGILMPTAALLASLPLALSLVHVGSELDWGASAPWQLVLLVAGGGAGVVSTAAGSIVLAATAALLWVSLAPAPRPRRPREEGEPGRSGTRAAVRTPAAG